MPPLPGAEALGWGAAALMVCTFACREPRAMRPLAVATNLAFLGYGAAASLAPVLALHALLLPINLWRWAQCLGAGDLSIMRHLTPRRRRAALAFVTALLLAACGGGGEPPPPEEPPLELSHISRSWQFERFLGSTRALSRIISFPDSRIDVPGPVGDEHELGGMVFNAPGGGDAIARLELFSSDDGMTYWAGAQAPNGELGDGRTVGGRVQFHQNQRWRKKAVNASLKYVITELQLDLIDANPFSLTFDECPWGERFTQSECRNTMYTRILFNFAARADRDPANFGPLETLIGRDGVAELNGWVGNWEHDLEEDWWAVWLPTDFTVDYDVSGDGSKQHARIKLIKPITLEVPIGALPIGADILVETELLVEAMNNRRRESYAGAWFRDPARTGGAHFEAVGLEPVPLQEVPPADPQQDPSPVCPGPADPAAGTLAFEATDLFTDELPGGGARIVIVREGGASGDVSVELRTRDGTATAGSDYTATQRRIWFRDGQTRRTVRLPVLLDGVAEPNETLTLALADPRGCAALGARTEATVTIRDDDRPAPPPPASYRVGGTVSGLDGSGLVLRDQAQAVSLPVAANGRFELDRSYSAGAAYDLRVATQPSNPPQICSVTRGSGTVSTNVTDIAVDCVTPPPPTGLDAAFGNAGKVTQGPGGVARAVALDAQGRIVAAIGNALARYLPDGTLDASFGSGGSVANVLGSVAGNEIFDVAIQADGRIVAAGKARASGSNSLGDDFAAARMNADGSRDGSFNGGQVLQVDWIGAPDRATRVLLQPDGRIVLAGFATTVYTGGGDDSAFAAVRLNADGSLDAGFGNGGRAVAEVMLLDFGYAAALQPDGKILVAGRISANRGDSSHFGAVRFNADGSLDSGFGSGGTLYIGEVGEVLSLALQPDGRIVLAIQHSDNGNLAFGLVRLQADGSVDTGFGAAGLAFAHLGPGRDSPAALALQADGRIVVAGLTAESNGALNWGVARFEATGTLDTSFGSGGFYAIDFFGGSDGAQDVVIQPDGRILVSGSAANGLSTLPAIVRIHP